VNGHLSELILVGVLFGALLVPRSTRTIFISAFRHPRSRSVMLLGEPPKGTGTILEGEITES
jgi:hypothetical protein